MDDSKMQVIGLCRFSYPALGGFQVEHDTPEARAAFLYDPVRMEERFATFQSLTLPPLLAQTDPDFTLAIVVGDAMPEALLMRLLDLVQDMPQAIVIPRAPGRHRQVMCEVINHVREDRPLPSLQFRMDDDDAVSVTFVQRLREAAGDLGAMLRKHRYIGIDFNQGHIARIGPEGIHAKPTVETLWTPALGMAVAQGASRGIMNFSHAKLGRVMPVVTLPGEDMYIRGHNQFNDSRQKDGIKPVRLPLLDAPGEAAFRQTYNIDADAVRRLYSQDSPCA
ncbi:putative rhamnosyl transferase [Roseovarius dicentrarchi]|uniref:putative rhamnosyl transferase n=1 Tax=Roseovarius dicentrarchi TaxID=2250573 RepID=UPI001EF00409|nr:putative rhamnosyl transferase [Roseovarius dicentrarchi]